MTQTSIQRHMHECVNKDASKTKECPTRWHKASIASRVSPGAEPGELPPLAYPKKNPNLISISLLLILIKNPNLIFSFDRNSNLNQSNTSIWTIFLIL